MKKDFKKLAPLLVVVLLLVAALWIRLSYFIGFIGSDDMGVWHRAFEISTGFWDAPADRFGRFVSLRYGIILPIAGLIKMFGVSELVAVSFPIFCSLLGMLLSWDIVRAVTGSRWLGLVPMAFIAVAGLDVSLSTVIFPDGPLTTMAMLTIWCLVKVDTRENEYFKNRGILILAGLATAYSIALKEAGIAVAAALAGWIAFLWLKNRVSKKDVMLVSLGFILGIGFECLVVWRIHGDPLFRYANFFSSMDNFRRVQGESGAVPNVLNLGGFVSTLFREFPSAVISIGFAFLGITLAGVMRAWRTRGIGPVLVFAAIFFAIRIPEAFVTYSYQPRRWLLINDLAIMLLVLTAWHASRIRAVRNTLATLIAVSLPVMIAFFFLVDAKSIELSADKLEAEKHLANWLRSNRSVVGDTPVYCDHRTARVMSLITADVQPPIRFDTYPLYWHVDEGSNRVLKPSPPIFSDADPRSDWQPDDFSLQNGFWFIDPSWIRRLAGAKWIPLLGAYLEEIPKSWPLVEVFERRTDKGFDAAGLLKISPASGIDHRVSLPWLVPDGKTGWKIPQDLDVSSAENGDFDVVVASGSKGNIIASPFVPTEDFPDLRRGLEIEMEVKSWLVSQASKPRIWIEVRGKTKGARSTAVLLREEIYLKRGRKRVFGFVPDLQEGTLIQIRVGVFGEKRFRMGPILLRPLGRSS